MFEATVPGPDLVDIVRSRTTRGWGAGETVGKSGWSRGQERGGIDARATSATGAHLLQLNTYIAPFQFRL